MNKHFFRKMLALLTVATMVISASAISAAAAGVSSEQPPAAADESPYENLLTEIESLPAPQKYASYKYVLCTDSQPKAGKYLVVSTYTSAVMSSEPSSYNSERLSAVPTLFSDNNTVIYEKDITPQCVFTLKKNSDGTYYMNDINGKYLSYNKCRFTAGCARHHLYKWQSVK